MTTLARSHVLLEVSARWLDSTDRFLEARKNHEPWPAPDVPLSMEAQQQYPPACRLLDSSQREGMSASKCPTAWGRLHLDASCRSSASQETKGALCCSRLALRT